MFAAVAAFTITRDAVFEFFSHRLPEYAYTSTTLAGFAVAAVAYGLATLWLRRLPQ
jgi:nitrate reductase gamma subunit